MDRIICTKIACIFSFIALVAVLQVGCGGTTKMQTPVSRGTTMKLITSAYIDNGRIPVKYANMGIAGGMNISPQFEWSGAPNGTKSFALAMIDVSANNWVHWLIVDIPPTSTILPEGVSGGSSIAGGGNELMNSFGKPGYGGPQPPAGTGDHSYITTVYALNVDKLYLSSKATYDEFLSAIDGKVIAKASLTGLLSQ